MKTPKEILEGAYGTRPFIDTGAFEKWISSIQQDAFESGKLHAFEMIARVVEAELPKFAESLRKPPLDATTPQCKAEGA